MKGIYNSIETKLNSALKEYLIEMTFSLADFKTDEFDLYYEIYNFHVQQMKKRNFKIPEEINNIVNLLYDRRKKLD